MAKIVFRGPVAKLQKESNTPTDQQTQQTKKKDLRFVISKFWRSSSHSRRRWGDPTSVPLWQRVCKHPLADQFLSMIETRFLHIYWCPISHSPWLARSRTHSVWQVYSKLFRDGLPNQQAPNLTTENRICWQETIGPKTVLGELKTARFWWTWSFLVFAPVWLELGIT